MELDASVRQSDLRKEDVSHDGTECQILALIDSMYMQFYHLPVYGYYIKVVIMSFHSWE